MRVLAAIVAGGVVLATAAAGPAGPNAAVDLDVTQDGCVVLASGKAACWGPMYKRDKPTVIDGIAHAIAVTSIYGPFVLRSDGSTQSLDGDKHEDAGALVQISGIAAIDKDGHARLGMPGKTEVVAGVSGAVALCTGEHHECFAQRDGKLVCVGSNGRGQLGTKPRGEQDNPDEPTAAEKAVAVPGIRDAASVACGSEHSCVLHRGGRVTCWGSGYQGNLGDGKDEEPGIRRVDVPGVTDAVAIAAAESGWTTCALRKTGALRCWGASYDWMPRAAQQAGFDLPKLAGVTKLQLTADHICALTSAGEVHCVGTLARVKGPVTTKTWQQVYP